VLEKKDGNEEKEKKKKISFTPFEIQAPIEIPEKEQTRPKKKKIQI